MMPCPVERVAADVEDAVDGAGAVNAVGLVFSGGADGSATWPTAAGRYNVPVVAAAAVGMCADRPWAGACRIGSGRVFRPGSSTGGCLARSGCVVGDLAAPETDVGCYPVPGLSTSPADGYDRPSETGVSCHPVFGRSGHGGPSWDLNQGMTFGHHVISRRNPGNPDRDSGLGVSSCGSGGVRVVREVRGWPRTRIGGPLAAGGAGG